MRRAGLHIVVNISHWASCAFRMSFEPFPAQLNWHSATVWHKSQWCLRQPSCAQPIPTIRRKQTVGGASREGGEEKGNTSFLSHGPWKASLLGNCWCYCHVDRAQNGQGSITLSPGRGGGVWLGRVGRAQSEGVRRPLRFIKVMAYVFVKAHLPSKVNP